MPRKPSTRAIVAAACAGLAALGGCETTTIYIERPGGTTGSTSTTTTSSSSTSSGMGGMGGAPLCIPGTMQPCYDGPPGTEGQGICQAGAQTCANDGMSWGPCAGAVLPQVENCATPEDEDCDGKAPPCKGNLLWAKRFGDSANQRANGIKADASGNVIVAGHFGGTMDFGGGLLTSAGSSDVFVVKLDANGDHVWSKRFGDADYQAIYGLAVDGAGNVIVTGTFSGNLDFGAGPLVSAGLGDIFVAKLDPNGNLLWCKRFGDAGDQVGTAVAADGAGNVIVTGYLYGSADFGGGPLASGGDRDIFVTKLDANGIHLWSKRLGGVGSQLGLAVAADDADNVLVAGEMEGPADLGGGPLIGGGGRDIFVARLDANGGHLWSNCFGDTSDQTGWAIAPAGSGDVVLVGSFAGAADLGGGPLASAGGRDVVAAKLSANGGHLWSKRFGDLTDQDGSGVAVDGMGNVLIAGSMNGSADFGGGPLQSGGSSDVFVAKLDANGGHLWAKRFGDAKGQNALGIATDGPGNVLLTGILSGSVDFGGGPLVSAGGTDVFVAKFGP